MTRLLILVISAGLLYGMPDRPDEPEELLNRAQAYKLLPENPVITERQREKSLIFNDYAQCDPKRLVWYSDLGEFTRALSLCGFENVRLRFDRTYKDSGVDVRASYYFTLKNTAVTFDSLRADLVYASASGTVDSSHLLVLDRSITIPHPLLISELVDRMLQESNRVQAYSAYAKTIHDSFLSRVVIKRTQAEPDYCFTFRIADKAYSIIGSAGARGNDAELVKHEERLSTLESASVTGAYAIGYGDVAVARATAVGIRGPLAQERNRYEAVSITDYALGFNGKNYVRNDRLQLFEINVTAKSLEGLRQIGIKVNGIWNLKDISGSTLASHSVRVPYDQECMEFEAKAVDIYGETVSEKNPRYIRDLEDNGVHSFDSLWQCCAGKKEGREVNAVYLKQLERRKQINKAKRITKNVLKLLPLLLF